MKKDNLIHWWNLSKTTHICLSKKLLIEIKKKRIKLNYTQEELGKLIGVKEFTIRNWEKNTRRPNTINLAKLLEKLKIPKNYVSKHIIYIKGEGKGSKIFHPKFPYNKIPEHIQIIAHGFFDGTLGHASEMQMGSLIYQSCDKVEQEIFKDLIKEANFGIFNITKNKQGNYSLPASLTKLLMKHYKICTLYSAKAKFPNWVFNKNKKWKCVILKAGFVDEGSAGKEKVRDNLCIFSSENLDLIKQISKILKSLKYKFFISNNSIYLYANDLQKFYKEIAISLPKHYYKRKNIEILLKRQKRENNIKEQLDKIRKILLKQKSISVIEIQKQMNLHEASARRRVKRLIKEGTIIKKGHGKYETNI